MNHEQKQLTVAVFGASGFIGQNLIHHLLVMTDYSIRAICRNPDKLQIDPSYADRVTRMQTDIFDSEHVANGLNGADAAVYLVHMMAAKGDYYRKEAEAATVFGIAAKQVGLRRVVYVSGLGNEADKLSRHLASRHNTGRILTEYVPVVIELRASMIIGKGSIAYDIMRRLVRKLPIQVIPSWAVTPTQPITLHDAIQYITASLVAPVTKSEIVDIGGPEQLSYKELIERYAAYVGKHHKVLVVPIVPIWLGGFFLNLFLPKRHARIGRQMAESLKNPMVVVNNKATELFPEVKPQPIGKSFH